MIKLREIRKTAGITSAQVASDLHLNRETYLGYESGRRSPDIETLKRFAAYFCVSVDDMVDYTGDLTIRDLQIIYNQLNDEDRKLLLKFAEFLKTQENEE